MLNWQGGRTGLVGEHPARASPARLHPQEPFTTCGLSHVRWRAGSAERCGSSTPPSKSSRDYAPDSAEIKPIYHRAASIKAGRVQRYLLLAARAYPPKVFNSDHGAGGSPWFRSIHPVLTVDGSGAPDGIDVSPQEWVDEWCAHRHSLPVCNAQH